MEQIVFSVSYAKGCYRHLAVPEDYTLEEFADAILWAFDFDNDHAHAFFMDNCAWSQKDCYMMEEVAEWEDKTTNAYQLKQLKLQPKQKFLFVFDFGEEHRFACKVLRIEQCTDDDVCIIKSVGDSPEQYPVWDDEEYEDE